MPKGFRHCHFAVVWRRARWVTVSQTGMGNWEKGPAESGPVQEQVGFPVADICALQVSAWSSSPLNSK